MFSDEETVKRKLALPLQRKRESRVEASMYCMTREQPAEIWTGGQIKSCEIGNRHLKKIQPGRSWDKESVLKVFVEFSRYCQPSKFEN